MGKRTIRLGQLGEKNLVKENDKQWFLKKIYSDKPIQKLVSKGLQSIGFKSMSRWTNGSARLSGFDWFGMKEASFEENTDQTDATSDHCTNYNWYIALAESTASLSLQDWVYLARSWGWPSTDCCPPSISAPPTCSTSPSCSPKCSTSPSLISPLPAEKASCRPLALACQTPPSCLFVASDSPWV